MLDLSLLNSPSEIVTGSTPRPAIHLPLTGNLDGGGLGVGSFKRASIGWYFDNVNVLQEAAVDVPRFTGNGLLIEPAATNICLHSSDLSNATWTKASGTTTTLDETGIDGTANSATTCTDPNASAVSNIKQTWTVADDSNKHTYSLFIKKDSDATTFPEILLYYTGGTGAFCTLQLNTSTGAVHNRASGTGSVEDWGDWWRLIGTLANNGSGNTTMHFEIRPAATATWEGANENAAVRSIIVGHVQVEATAFATSPIITEGTSVTRATEAGVAGVSGAEWTINTALTNMLEETLGSDLVTNGDFAADTDWIKGSGLWTIAAGVATKAAGDAEWLFQNVGATSGIVYKVTYTLSNVTAGQVVVAVGGTSSSAKTANGTYTEYLTAGNAFVQFKPDSSFAGNVDDVVVEEVTNDSRGTMVVDWTPHFVPGTIGTDVTNILTVTRNIYTVRMHSSNLKGYFNDETADSISPAIAAWDLANQTMRLAVKWGVDSSNVRKSAIQILDPDGSWQDVATIGDYAGSWASASSLNELIFAYNSGYPASTKNLQFFNTVLTDAEIEAL